MARLVELNTRPDERTLRRFGALTAFVFGALAVCAWRESWPFSSGLGAARVASAVALGAVAITAAAFAVVKPAWNRVLYVGLVAIGYPVGLVLSHAAMAALFFGVIAPIGLLLRLLDKDPLQRTLERDRASYWTRARGPRSRESYFRQF
jgi:hypothetical protein